MAVKLTKEQQVVIDRLASGNVDIHFDTGPKVAVRPSAFEYSRDGDAILVSRVVLRSGRDGTDPRLDWNTECYRIQKNGEIKKL